MCLLRLGMLAILWGALPTMSWGQLPQIRLRSIFPPSAQAGQTVELRLSSGDDLEEVSALYFTHPGITATPKLQEVEGRQTPVDNVFRVSIAGDVPPGIYEVRAAGLWGASNPQRFAVGPRPQVVESDDNNRPDKAQPVELNTSIVGQMNGGQDVDCFRFRAEAGQRVIIDCLAERLDSRMAAEIVLLDSAGRRLAASHDVLGADPLLVFDVPAAGEYVVQLHDHTYRNGDEYTYRLDLHTGPQLAFVMPPAGPAATRSRFTLWGYNLPGGQRTDVAVPSAGASSTPSAPLEKLDVEIDVPREDAVLSLQNIVRSYEADIDAFSWSLDSPQGKSNPVRIGISGRAALAEVEPNDTPAQALAVRAPVEVAGQLTQPGDRDWVAFPGQPGEVYWIEVLGQRTGSTLDPVLVVEEVTTDGNGTEQVKRLTQQDDDGANVAQNVFDSFTDDPEYRLAVDKAATYRVAVYDRYGQTRGDPSLRYQLCIRGEEPDFRVVAVPAQKQNNTGTVAPIGLRKGDSVGVDLYALRQRGYDGPIEVSVEGLPAGVTSPGTTIGSKESAGVIVFRAAEDAPETVANVRLIARAVIEHPAARRSLDEAAKRVVDAEKAFAELRKKLDDARQRLNEAVRQRDEAAVRSGDDPGNAGLAQTLTQRQQELEARQQELGKAAEELSTAEQQLAAARVALERVEAEAPARVFHRRHIVRSGTLVSGGQNNVPAAGRLAQSLAIAVLKETAPFELRPQVERVVTSQSAQLLVPIQLIRRHGFDGKVQLTVQGIPKNSNLQAQNFAIEKDQQEALAAIFVKENTPPGIYTLWFDVQGQVQYSRNPERTARIVAERDTLAGDLKAAQAAAQAATEAKSAAIQQAKETAAALQQAQQAKQKADELVTQRTNELNTLKPQKAAADVRVDETSKAVAAAEAALQAAQEALAADAENADLKTAVSSAETALATARQQAQEAAAARDALATKLADAERLLTEGLAAQKSAAEAVPRAEQAQQAAAAAQTAAEAAEKAAQDAVKQADDRKKAADKRVEEAEKISKPQSKNFTPTLEPIVFEVVPAPLKLNASVPNGGGLKAGQTLEIGVKLERLNRFTGPVRLALALPPKATGISGETTVPADAVEGKLVVTAAADAPEGPLSNVVLRATVEQQGRTLAVDVPVTIKISK